MKIKKFLTEYPELLKEWNYDKNVISPTKYVVGSAKKVWWKCSICGHEWETSIRHRTLRGNGCPICAKQKMTDNRLKSILNKKGGIKNPILLKEWGCISDASRDLKINSSNISMCAGHKRRIAGDYRWEYAYAKQLNAIAPIKTRHKGTGGKTVLQLDDDGNIIKEYKSLTDAAEKLNMDATNISKVLHGQCKKAGGYKWKLK